MLRCLLRNSDCSVEYRTHLQLLKTDTKTRLLTCAWMQSPALKESNDWKTDTLSAPSGSSLATFRAANRWWNWASFHARLLASFSPFKHGRYSCTSSSAEVLVSGLDLGYGGRCSCRTVTGNWTCKSCSQFHSNSEQGHWVSQQLSVPAAQCWDAALLVQLWNTRSRGQRLPDHGRTGTGIPKQLLLATASFYWQDG